MSGVNGFNSVLADKMILGQDVVFFPDSNLNNNVLVVGASGTGKTTSILEPYLLECYQKSLIVTVTKRKIVDMYQGLFLSRGYEVNELNFVTPEKSTIGYDPLADIEGYGNIHFFCKSFLDAAKVRNGEIRTNDAYWDNAALSLFIAVVGLVKYGSATTKSLKTVIDKLAEMTIEEKEDGLIRTNMDAAFAKLDQCGEVGLYRRNYISFCNLPVKTAGCILSELNTVLFVTFNEQIMKNISRKPQFDFTDLAHKKSVLFIVSSPINQSSNLFISHFMGTGIKILFEYAEHKCDGALPVPVHLLCDDYATGAGIPNLENTISIIREKCVSVSLFCQSETQLSKIYGSFNTATIINNCDTYCYLGGSDLESCQNISARMGCAVQEILQMRVGNLIVMRRGSKPLMVPRYATLDDPKHQAVANWYEAMKNADAATKKKILAKLRNREKTA